MKTLLVFTLFFGIMIISVYNALAIVEILNPLGGQDQTIADLVDKIATWLLEIGLVIAVIIVLWAALLFMTSGGNATKVTTARNTLWYAIIGIALLLLAKGVTSIVQSILSGS